MIDIIINVLMKILFQTRQHRPLKHFIFVCRILGNKVHVNAVNELALKCHSRNNAQLYVGNDSIHLLLLVKYTQNQFWYYIFFKRNRPFPASFSLFSSFQYS